MNKPLEFHCDFGSGIAVTIKFDVAQYLRSRNQALAQKIEWTGQPTRKIIPRYIQWIHTVNVEIAKAINGNFLYVAQVGPKQSDWEYWEYHPDGNYERIQ